MYASGEGVAVDNQAAAKWFRLAAEQGNVNSQFLLGALYDNGKGVAEDNQEAVKWYRLAAEQGHVDAQYELGVMYYKGEGVAEDNIEAAKWFRMAAEQGFASAQFALGLMYDNGAGMPEDNIEAIKWYRLAAEQNYAKAQSALGVMYDIGEGVPEDNIEAIKWYRLAVEQGDAKGQYLLGTMYDYGESVPEDDREAVEWYRLAAGQGFARAQSALGGMYWEGDGVEQDLYEAYIWFFLSAENGYEYATGHRDRVASLLSASEIQRANREAERRMGGQTPQRSVVPDVAYQIKPSFSKPVPSTPAEVAYENGWRSIVVIETNTDQGSGVIIRPNLVATNCHVLNGSGPISVYKADNRKAQLDSVHYGTISYQNNDRDLCLLDVPGLWGIPASIRRASDLLVGENVYVIGAPQGLDYSLSAGIVSQLRSGGGAPVIQTDAAVSPGSSGGGLFDGEGNLVGVVTEKLVDEDIEGISFAIPVDWILESDQF